MYPTGKTRQLDVVFVSTDPIGEGVGRSQVLPVVTGLAERGWNMGLVSVEAEGSVIELGQRLQAMSVTYSPAKYSEDSAPSILHRALLTFRALPKARLYHTRSDLALTAALLRHPARARLWDVRSRWGEQKRVINQVSTQRAQLKMAGVIEALGARYSKGMLTLTELAALDLEAQHGRIPIKRRVVPTLTDTKHFAFLDGLPTNTLRLLFSGSYNNFYDLDLSVKFIEQVASLRPTEVTWTREKSTPPNNFPTLRMNRLIYSNYEDLPDIIRSHSAGLAICRLDAGPSLRAAVPTKIGEFLSCGRPVVVSQGLGGIDELVEEHAVGVVVRSSDDEHLRKTARKFEEILLDPNVSIRCRNLAERHFALSSGVDAIDSLYRQLLGEPTSG